MASVATEEVTRSSDRGKDGEASFFFHFEAVTTTLESVPILFFEEPPPRVFTISRVWAKNKDKKIIEKKENREKMRAFGFERQMIKS